VWSPNPSFATSTTGDAMNMTIDELLAMMNMLWDKEHKDINEKRSEEDENNRRFP
jgi:hypothetical protein